MSQVFLGAVYTEPITDHEAREQAMGELAAALSKIMRWVDSHPRKATIVESVKDEAHKALQRAKPFLPRTQGAS